MPQLSAARTGLGSTPYRVSMDHETEERMVGTQFKSNTNTASAQPACVGGLWLCVDALSWCTAGGHENWEAIP